MASNGPRGPRQGVPPPKPPSGESGAERGPRVTHAKVIEPMNEQGLVLVLINGKRELLTLRRGAQNLKAGEEIRFTDSALVRAQTAPGVVGWVYSGNLYEEKQTPVQKSPAPVKAPTPPAKPAAASAPLQNKQRKDASGTAAPAARKSSEFVWQEEPDETNLFGLDIERFEHREGRPLRSHERVVCVLMEDAEGKRYFQDRNGTIVFYEEQNPSMKEFKELALGTLVVLQTPRGKTEWQRIDTLGVEGTYASELLRLGYDLDRGRIAPPEVQAEIERLEKNGQQMIDKELVPEKLVKAFEGDWMKEYAFGENRVDFRHIPLIAIDPDGARDHDDILGIYEHVDDSGKKTGVVSVIISISDTNHFVRPGSVLDREAAEHGTSIYPLGGVMPMQPAIISGGTDASGKRQKGLCSLAEGEDRLTNSMVFTYDRNGKLLGRPFKCASVSRSAKTHTYEEAERIRKGEKSPFQNLIRTLDRLAKVQEAHRNKFGQIDVESAEEYRLVDGRLVLKEKNRMNDVVAAWMISANVEQGRRLAEAREKEGLPGFFRVHPTPEVSDLQAAASKLGDQELADICMKYQYEGTTAEISRLKGPMPFENFVMLRLYAHRKVTEKEKQQFSREGEKRFPKDRKKAEAHAWRLYKKRKAERADQVRFATRKLLEKAVFDTKPESHFGLAARQYAFFTSPIRRKFDHEAEELDRARQLKERGVNISTYNVATEEELEELGSNLLLREREANDIERLSYRMYAAEQLQSRIGETITVLIGAVVLKEGKLKGIKVFIPVPGSDYVQDFFVSPEDFEGLPLSPGGSMQFRDKEIAITLLGTDVAEGKVRIALPKSQGPEVPPRTRAPRRGPPADRRRT